MDFHMFNNSNFNDNKSDKDNNGLQDDTRMNWLEIIYIKFMYLSRCLCLLQSKRNNKMNFWYTHTHTHNTVTFYWL